MPLKSPAFSIPKVNPNPRPPNEQSFKLPGFQPYQKKPLPNSPIAKFNLPGLSGQAGGASSAASSTQQQAPPQFANPVDPRDARYWQDLAQLSFNKEMGLQRLTTEGQFDETQYKRELAQRDYLDPLEVQKLRENANVGGMIYSTATKEALGNLGQEQFSRRAGMSEALQRAIAQRALEKQEIEGNYTIGSEGLGLEATERAAAGELDRPGPVTEEYNPYGEAIKNRANGKPKKNKNKKKTSGGFTRGYNINRKPPKQQKKRRR